MWSVDHRLFSIRFAGMRLMHAGRNWSSCELSALFTGAMLRCPSQEILKKQVCLSVKGEIIHVALLFSPKVMSLLTKVLLSICS